MAWTVVGLLVGSAGGAAADPDIAAPGPAGTIETVAGPRFCQGTATLDREAHTVRALAVGADGRFFVDTGPRSQGLIASVSAQATFPILTSIPVGSDPIQAADGSDDGVPPASRLAPDGQDGVLFGGGAKLIRSGAGGNDVAAVAGELTAPLGGSGSVSVGDGGPAGDARFRRILSVASDAEGNAFVADEIDERAATARIRFVNRSPSPVTFFAGTPREVVVAPGAIDTVVGEPGGDLGGGDGGPARTATVAGRPPALAVVGGRLYIASYGPEEQGAGRQEARVRMVNLGAQPVAAHGKLVGPGAIETVAGGGRSGSAEGRSAVDASFSYLPGITADGDGNLYLAEEAAHRVWRVDAEGQVSAFAGAAPAGPGGGGFDGNGRPATTARLDRPYGVGVGPDGRVYIADQGNGQVRFVDRAGLIHAALGNGLGLWWACDDDPSDDATTTTLPVSPIAVATGPAGEAYVVAEGLAQVKKIEPGGRITTVVGNQPAGERCAGVPACVPVGGDGGPAREAGLARPVALWATKEGLYVLDGGDNRVRFVNLTVQRVQVHGVEVAPGAIETVAGDGTIGRGGDGGPAVAAQLFATGLTADTAGNLFVADSGNRRVRLVDPEGVITTVLGTDEPITADGLAADQAGNLYVADQATHRVLFLNRGAEAVTRHGRSVAPGGMAVVAGTGESGFAGDGGPGAQAQLRSPAGLALDGKGNLYIADVDEETVRRLDANGFITTVAGTGVRGFNGDALEGPRTALSRPRGLALDRCGNLLIADSGNSRVRRLNLEVSCDALGSSPAASSGHRSLLVVGLAVAVVAASCAVGARRILRKPPTSGGCFGRGQP